MANPILSETIFVTLCRPLLKSERMAMFRSLILVVGFYFSALDPAECFFNRYSNVRK